MARANVVKMLGNYSASPSVKLAQSSLNKSVIVMTEDSAISKTQKCIWDCDIDGDEIEYEQHDVLYILRQYHEPAFTTIILYGDVQIHAWANKRKFAVLMKHPRMELQYHSLDQRLSVFVYGNEKQIPMNFADQFAAIAYMQILSST